MIKKTVFISTAFATALVGSTMVKGHDSEEREFRRMEHKMHHRHEHMRHGFMRAFAQLDLSEEQKTKLKALKAGNQDVAETRRESLHNIESQIQQLMKADAIDDAQIKALTSQAAELKADQLIFAANMKKQAIAILTDEQREKFDAMKAKREAKMRRWREGE